MITNTMRTLASSTFGKEAREENDFYATEPRAVILLLQEETFNKNIWEPCCGQGHISKVLEENGYIVKSTDLIDRGYGEGNIDFLSSKEKWNGDIITNPPYKNAIKFVEHGINLIEEGNKLAVFLKLQFLEGVERRKFYDINPPRYIYIASKRLNCAKNGDFEKYKSSAVAYAWFVWYKGYKGKPEIVWIN